MISNSKYCRKPTMTDMTIHAESHYAMIPKMATYNSLIHRLVTVPLDKDDFEEKLNIFKYIVMANGYKCQMIIFEKKLKKE